MSRNKRFIKQMFSEIIREYDIGNSIISLFTDNFLRRAVIKRLTNKEHVLDICSGTGSMAIELLKNKEFVGNVVMVDFNMDTLLHARKRFQKLSIDKKYHMVIGDADFLPFKSCIFDGAMMGFALRYMDIPLFSSQLRHTMSQGGKMIFVEVSHPENSIVAYLFHIYFYKVVPFMSKIFTRNTFAYEYLAQSLKAFCTQKELINAFRERGFDAAYDNRLFGASTIYTITKKGNDRVPR
ncbi:MAG: class I SAM-dependent methyltransferase [Thermodesulfobacteriota bacterium]|nr:class I SAM-dependent methyltransferase [Thermodesulfobacteriota bacterium]